MLPRQRVGHGLPRVSGTDVRRDVHVPDLVQRLYVHGDDRVRVLVPGRISRELEQL